MIEDFGRNGMGRIAAALVGMGVMGVALGGGAEERAAVPGPAAAREIRIEKGSVMDMTVGTALGKKMPECRIENQPLSVVIDWLRELTALEISVNWSALEAAGITKTTAVNAHFGQVPLSKAWSIILDNAAGGENKVGFKADEEVLCISTVADLNRPMVNRVYDVRDLMERNLGTVPGTKENGAQKWTWALEEGRAAFRERDREEAATADIARAVIGQFDKERWRKEAAIESLRGQLFVRMTVEGHDQVAGILEGMRKAKGLQVTLETRLVEVDQAVLEKIQGEGGRTWKVDWAPLPKSAAISPRTDVQGAILDDQQMEELLRTMDMEHRFARAAPIITVRDGQEATVGNTVERDYISAITPSTKLSGEVEYLPIVSTLQAGVSVKVRPTVSADGKSVIVRVQPRLCFVSSFKDEGEPEEKKVFTQRPVMDLKALDAQVSIPNGRTLVLSGFRLVHALDTPLDQGKVVNDLIMLVKPTVIERR